MRQRFFVVGDVQEWPLSAGQGGGQIHQQFLASPKGVGLVPHVGTCALASDRGRGHPDRESPWHGAAEGAGPSSPVVVVLAVRVRPSARWKALVTGARSGPYFGSFPAEGDSVETPPVPPDHRR